MDAQGSATATVRLVVAGEFARRWRSSLLAYPRAQWAKAVAKRLHIDEGLIHDVQVENDAPPLEPTPVTLTFRAVRFDQVAAFDGASELDTMVFNLQALVGAGLPDLRDEPRGVPVLLGPTRDSTLRREVVLPPGWHVQNVPPDLDEDTDFATLRSTHEVTERGWVSDVHLVVKAPTVLAGDAPTVGKLARRARVAFNPQLILHRQK